MGLVLLSRNSSMIWSGRLTNTGGTGESVGRVGWVGQNGGWAEGRLAGTAPEVKQPSPLEERTSRRGGGRG